MPPASDSANEIRRLRERVYGADAAADPSDVARLHELEARYTGETPPEHDDPRAPAPPETGASETGASETARPATTPGRPVPHRRRWRVIAAAVGAAVVIGGVAFAAGVLVATPSEAADVIPELLLPQTEEDVVATGPSDPVAESVDPSSTRFIARIDGLDIFLARPAGSDVGVCVFTRVASTPALSGAGCSGGTQIGYGMVGGLQVVVGESTGPVAGEPIRLSESVTAYLS